MTAVTRFMPAFALCILVFCSVYAAGNASTFDDFGMGPGGGVDKSIEVRFGDLVHIEWTTDHSVSYELRYQTKVNYTEGGAGISYGGPVDSGQGIQGNYTFYSKINGTYALHFVTDANASESTHFHILMTATSNDTGYDGYWLFLGLGLVAVAIAAVLVSLVIRRIRWKRKG